MKSTQHFVSRLSQFFIIVSCFTLIAGCNTGNVKFVQSSSSDNQPGLNEGILVASISNAAGSGAPFNQLTITPKNFNESEGGQYIRLRSNESVTGSSSYFSAYVPEGEYSISTIRAYHSNYEYWISNLVPAATELGTFSVRAGETTDLGTLIYYIKPETDSYTKTVSRAPSLNNKQLSQGYAAYIDYTSKEILSWDEDGFDDERRNTYISMVRNPTSYNDKTALEDGSIVFVSELGAIMTLSPDDEFSLDAVDTDFDLNTYAVDGQSGALLGGDFGKVFFKPRGSDDWEDLSIDSKYRVTTAEINHGKARLFAYTDKYVAIFERDLLSADSEWARRFVFYPKVGWLNSSGDSLGVGGVDLSRRAYRPRRISSVSVESHDGVIYVFIGTRLISPNGILERTRSEIYELSSDGSIITESKGLPDGVDEIIDVGENKLAVKKAGWWSWTGKDSYFVLDRDGSTWEKINTEIENCEAKKGVTKSTYGCLVKGEPMPVIPNFNFGSLPVFMSPTKAFAIAVLKKVKRSDESDSRYLRSLVKTEDGGQTWMHLDYDLPSKYCGDFVVEYKRGILLSCSGISGDFYRSEDEGQTWEQIREHENF